MPGWFFSSAELAEHRADQESLMTLTLSAFSPPTSPTKDSDGMETSVPVAQGKTIGRLGGQTGSAATDPHVREVQVGGVTRPVIQSGILIPTSAPIPEIGWEYVVTAVGPNDDAALKNRRFHVVSVPVKSDATVRRLDVVEV